MLTYRHAITIDQNRNKAVRALGTQSVSRSYTAMFGEAYDLLFHLLKLNSNIIVLRLVQFSGLLFTFKMQLFLLKTMF